MSVSIPQNIAAGYEEFLSSYLDVLESDVGVGDEEGAESCVQNWVERATDEWGDGDGDKGDGNGSLYKLALVEGCLPDAMEVYLSKSQW